MKRLEIYKTVKAPATHECGGCTACCDIIGIRELGKPYYARCIHKQETGCGIYLTRPGSCEGYRCGWHLNLLGAGDEWKPDTCGIMVQLEPDGADVAIELYEVWPSAFAPDVLRRLIELIHHHYRIRKLPLTAPLFRLYEFGSDIAISYPVSEPFASYPPPAIGSVRLAIEPDNPDAARFTGKLRGLQLPITNGQ